MKKWFYILIVVLAIGICGWFMVREQPIIVEPTAPAATEAPAPTEVPTEAPAEETADAAMMAENAEETAEEETVESIYGEIMEITPEYIVIKNPELGDVQVNLFDDTLFEGLEKEQVAVGQTAVILYNGMMTRSIPAQISAMKVSVHYVTGTVASVEEDGSVLLDRSDVEEQVVIHLPEGMTVKAGETITVYTDGTMTMSLPAQMSALAVIVNK